MIYIYFILYIYVRLLYEVTLKKLFFDINKFIIFVLYRENIFEIPAWYWYVRKS